MDLITYIVIAEGRLEQAHPGAEVASEWGLFRLRMTFVQEVERLGKSKQHDHVDDTEGEHVTGDHGEDHGYEGTCQSDGTAVDWKN